MGEHPQRAIFQRTDAGLKTVDTSGCMHPFAFWGGNPPRLDRVFLKGGGGVRGGVWFGLGQRLPRMTRPTVSATVPARLDWVGRSRLSRSQGVPDC